MKSALPRRAWPTHEPAEPYAETPDSHPEEPQQKPRTKRSGPRKMVDQPTQRFEGQMYVKQYDQGMQVVNRLKREKSSVPPAERRRLTLNTLVRVAMTVLLEHRQALKGVTEEELLGRVDQGVRGVRLGALSGDASRDL